MQIRGGAGEIIVHRRKIDPNFFFRQEIHGSIEQAAVEQIPFEIGINAVPWKKKKKEKSVEGPSGTLVFAERAYPLERALVKSCQISRDLLSRAIYREFSGLTVAKLGCAAARACIVLH